MNNSELIVHKLETQLNPAERHLEYIDAGTDLDGETAHILIRPRENDCLALIEAISDLATINAKLTGIHCLTGKLLGVIELDAMTGKTKIPAFWSVYNQAPDIGEGYIDPVNPFPLRNGHD